jgi:hypothetical protein
MVPEMNVYHHVDEIDELFDNYDLTVPFDYTAKWHNNAQWIVDVIKSECES